MNASPAIRWLTLVLRLALGVVLVYASWSKIAHPDQFADAVANYRLLPSAAVSWPAITLPWLELLTGVWLLIGVTPAGPALLAAGMFTAFAVALTSAQARHLDISCGCFNASPTSGESHSLMLSLALMAGSLVLLVLVVRWPGRLLGVPPLAARLSSTIGDGFVTRRVVVVALAAGLAIAIGVGLATDQPEKASANAGRPLELLGGRDVTGQQLLADLKTAQPSISLKIDKVSGGDEVLKALEEGSRPDLIECGAEQLPWLVQQGYIVGLDTSRVRPWSQLDERFLSAPGLQSSGQSYAAPIDATTVGILYDAKAESGEPQSYRDLLLPRYKKRVALPNDTVVGITVGASMLGMNPAKDLSSVELARVERLLVANKTHFLFYKDRLELQVMFRAGRIDIAVGDLGSARHLAADGVKVRFAAPREGAFVKTACVALSASSHDPAKAYAVVDYYLSREAQAVLASLTGGRVSNEAARAQTSDEGFMSQTSLSRLSHAVPLPAPSDLVLWRQAWRQVAPGCG